MPFATFLQKSPMVILAVIASLLAYQLALLTWAFVPENKPALLWKPASAKNNQDSSQINTRQLQQQHLFGEKAQEVKTVVQETTIDNAPKTRLNLKLVGVVASSDPQNSSVIIDNKGRQGSYFMNSKIDGTSAVIKKIYQDRIILEVNGSHQTLMLDGVESLDKQHLSHEKKGQTTKSQQVVKAEVKTVNLNRKELLKNPGKLTDYIRISPVRENGKVKGYRVKPGKNRALFEQAGLKSGDLAVELNGIDLTDTQQAFTLMKAFPTMTDMTLSVERGGQLHELYFSIP
ncbi:type II secretion system protein GspC [Psychromonas sp. Urea-02u-13]|uniref:type II secretion system protein GspC n=1 Tax=Psychromonas sp. Urea-02u-13 TaxID=2058326 RepID=UPI000C31E2A9|nr:type II secretion system protein GspC [Psychromonas sp. Urea-02u-13]PKG40189.1 type II secretion system protein GspC [Psychromonas sp. Urea-02u-13]